VVRVDADFEEEYPGGDPTCTEAYASLVRTGQALLGELDRRVRLTFDVSQPAATALAVIDGAREPLTPSQVSDRALVASATMTSTLDLLEHRAWIRRIPNPDDRRSVLIEITPDERTQLLDLLAKVLARTADIAGQHLEPLTGPRVRPARLAPQQTPEAPRPDRPA
jgi:DNA-binding MarR family transcriptional regulator